MGEVYRARDTRLDATSPSRCSRRRCMPIRTPWRGSARRRARRQRSTIRASSRSLTRARSRASRTLSPNCSRARRCDSGWMPAPVPSRRARHRHPDRWRTGAAHFAGIVHRDIKPENVFVARGGAIKILDFGVARLGGDPSGLSSGVTAAQTTPGSVIGTAGYMAPEQARGQAVDSRADVFAFGCVLYEMLAGRRAFGKATPIDTIAAIVTEDPADLPESRGVPPGVQRILMRCLKERSRRTLPIRGRPRVRADHRARGPGVGGAGSQESRSRAAMGGRGGHHRQPRARRHDVERPIGRRAADVHRCHLRGASRRQAHRARAVTRREVGRVHQRGGERAADFVQFLNGGVPVNLTEGMEIPIPNRTIVGGIDIAPDGSAIGFAGRPRASGLWTIPGVWTIPAPQGGPPRRVNDCFGSVRWSPDGRQFAAVLANPLVGDAVVVSDTDGQNERVVVPAGGGLHLHQWPGHPTRSSSTTRSRSSP